MKHIFVILFIFCGLLFSCSSADTDKLTFALEEAGDNAGELLKILQHYKDDPDTLKYAAAKFLIENMPYHYGGYNESISKIEAAKKEFIANEFVSAEVMDSMKKHFNFKFKLDVQYIKADFLIHNIDQAFDAWRKRPWGKYYSFADFCEYLLPYRTDNEPLEEWREKYAARYGFLLDSIYTGSDVVKAATTVCLRLREEGFHHTNIFDDVSVCSSPSFLLDYRTGSCTEESNFTIHVLRSLGIPIQNDFYAYSPETYSSHGWCVLLDTTKQNIPLCYTEFLPIRSKMQSDERKKCKVYRRTYRIQDDVFASRADEIIPRTLKDPFRKDVSSEYFHTTLCLPVKDKKKKYILKTPILEHILPY